MRKILILVFFLMGGIVANAQKPDWGRAQVAEKKRYDPQVVGEDEDYIYTAYVHRFDMILEKFDKKKLNRKYSKSLEMPIRGDKDYDFEGITFINGNYILFASYYDRKKKTFELRAFSIDGDKARFKEDIVLFENEVERKSRKGDFKIYPSKNRNTLLAFHRSYYKKKEQTIESFKLLNSELDVLIEKSDIYEGKGYGSSTSFVVDDEGSVYYFRGNSIVILDATSDYEEWSQEVKLDEQERGSKLLDRYLSLNEDNDPVVIASYVTVDYKEETRKQNKKRSERKEGDTQIEGMFFMKIDGLTKETVVTKLSKFDKDFIDQFKSRKDIKKGRDAEVNMDYSNYNFYFKEDGGVVFIGESSYVVRYYRNGSLVGENYYFGDLVSYNFTPEGDMLWAQRIPKNQVFSWTNLYLGFTMGSYGMSWVNIPYYTMGTFSYMAGLSNDKLYIIFNDNPKNSGKTNESDKLRVHTKIKKGVPTLYTVDLETGIKTKKVEPSFASGNEKLRPSNAFQARQNDPIYIYAMGKKNYKFGKIDFNEVRGKRKRSASIE